MKLHSAMLFVKDMQKMLTFYRDGFGLRLRTESATPAWAELEAGGAVLALHAVPPEIAGRIDIASPPAARTETPIKLVFQVSAPQEARNHLISCGAVMFEPRAFGRCDGLDPEGNVFQLVAE